MLLYTVLAEVRGIALVIIRLAAILPTSKLDPCSTCALHSTQSWSCLDSKLISPSKLISSSTLTAPHFTLTMHSMWSAFRSDPFCFKLLKLVDSDTLHSLSNLVIAAGHESPGWATVWLAWSSRLNVHPYWPSSLPSSCHRGVLPCADHALRAVKSGCFLGPSLALGWGSLPSELSRNSQLCLLFCDKNFIDPPVDEPIPAPDPRP